ncbi:hypothetical protein NQ317_010838 [Molorchus minor]|uniref:Uncharacterized protein n=1 Tax=Molorchus minor TaxID=1323400 RepID=A0ABQ9JLP8_9CUCU|nr:hypothetical protein NQ317_010838 [Molorchus minor]
MGQTRKIHAGDIASLSRHVLALVGQGPKTFKHNILKRPRGASGIKFLTSNITPENMCHVY